MVPSVEEVSSSLVREYLSRKGLKRTIACMDEEHPRTEASINNRSELRQILSIDDLYRKNKLHNNPLKTLLEVIVKHLIEQVKNEKPVSSEVSPRRGLKRTIACMDEEHPRTEASINNRSELRQILSIDDLYRKNKLHNNPLKTLLEVIVKHLIEQVKNEKPVSSEVSPRRAQTSPMDNGGEEDSTPASVPSKQTRSRLDITATFPSQATNASLMPANDRKSSNSQTGFWGPDLGVQKDHPAMDSLQDKTSLIQKEPEKNTSETTQRSRTNRIRRGILAGPVPQESNRKRNSRKVSQPLLRGEEETRPTQDGRLVTGGLQGSRSGIGSADCVRGGREAPSVSQRTPSENSFERVRLNMVTTTKAKTRPSVADLDASAMVLDDIEDYDDDLRELCDAPLRGTLPERSLAGRPMDQRTATELKTLLLGSSLNCFNIEWRNQGFTFSDTHDLRYGIVQRKGGPCGVLASVQAFVLKKLLFESTESCTVGLQRLRPSNSIRRKCLVLALAEILWRAGEEKQATVAINSGRNQFIAARPYRSEGVLEKITCLTVENLKDLELILEQHVEQFEPGMLGCVLLTVSAVLSRSIQKVQEDMDVPTTTLIGAHGYCTQELVNLLLCGRAVSNVFDDDVELDSGNGNMTLLKGVKGHCDVGLLSLFEHYNICKVRNPDPLTDHQFDSSFGNQYSEIFIFNWSFPKNLFTDLTPPLELCIRTRWKDAFVSWNDTEPIL
ncbi:probable ubiquitin carboxyl-terminal hydrolase MINDY-4 [Neolamprologus brichardi]|uniref:probable ubiquitin carboxyl-terminal hydrolase MINDY-4 n=1 Tax=Neolamprologus brichardi TaxID=32507 RepID=UPI0003EC6774|nr:probable ubiquitin carboxyl-terminal hydrolase MINDY-4 [Neolamprologus brichardi]